MNETDELNKIKEIHKSDYIYLQEAFEAAKKSNMQHKHGCIIVDNKGNIISSGYNKYIFVPIDKIKVYNKYTRIKISKHAEEMALKNADPRKLDGAKLYIVRINIKCNNENNNENIDYNENILEKNFMFSKPCKRCTSIIESCMKKCGLKKVYYT